MSLFKFELIEFKVEKNLNGRYTGKGRGKLGIAEVNVEAYKGYSSIGFVITLSDGQKTIAISDLKKLGFEINTMAIESEFDRQVKLLEIEVQKRRMIQRAQEYDESYVHTLKKVLSGKNFICEIQPTREKFLEDSFSMAQL
jgi:hypothetical protein